MSLNLQKVAANEYPPRRGSKMTAGIAQSPARMSRFFTSVTFLVLFWSAAVAAAGLTPKELDVLRGSDLGATRELAAKIGREANVQKIRDVINIKPDLIHNIAISYPKATTYTLPSELEDLIAEQFASPSATPNTRHSLTNFIGGHLDGNGDYYPKYQSRRLFDLLYAAAKSNLDNNRSGYISRAVMTNQKGIEQEVIAFLPMSSGDNGALIHFLGKRRYAGAVPALKSYYEWKDRAGPITRALLNIGTPEAKQAVLERMAMLSRRPEDSNAKLEIANHLFGMSQLPADKLPDLTAILSVLPSRLENHGNSYLGKLVQHLCLPATKIPATEQAGKATDCVIAAAKGHRFELQPVLDALGKVPREIDIGFTRLRSALPNDMTRYEMRSYIQLVGQRQEERGVQDLLSYMEREMTIEKPASVEAVNALLSFPFPDIWQRVKTELQKIKAGGKLEDGLYRYAVSGADQKLRDPAFALKQQADMDANRLLQAERSAIPRPASLNDGTRTKDPERYIREYRAYLAALGQLARKYPAAPFSVGLRSEIIREYRTLGDLLRYEWRRPRDAIAMYGHVDELQGADDPRVFMYFLIAETYQLNLNDKVNAILYYEKAQALVRAQRRSTNDMESSMQTWMERALQHELAYLKTGKTFRGKPDLADMAGAMVMAYFSPAYSQQSANDASHRCFGPTSIELRSHWNLSALVHGPVAEKEVNAILQYVRDNDPGGYWTASLFAGILTAGQINKDQPAGRSDVDRSTASAGRISPVLEAASRQWMRSHNIEVWSADKRKASPQQTWDLFISSLKAHDVSAALGCLTPGMRSRLEVLFRSLSPAQMRDMAASFGGFSMQGSIGEFKEAVVTRLQADGKSQAGFVYFVDSAGEWLINEM